MLFVLKKALEAHVKPIVVINKIDRPNANPKKAVDEVLSLFIELGAPEEFLDFQVERGIFRPCGFGMRSRRRLLF